MDRAKDLLDYLYKIADHEGTGKICTLNVKVERIPGSMGTTYLSAVLDDEAEGFSMRQNVGLRMIENKKSGGFDVYFFEKGNPRLDIHTPFPQPVLWKWNQSVREFYELFYDEDGIMNLWEFLSNIRITH